MNIVGLRLKSHFKDKINIVFIALFTVAAGHLCLIKYRQSLHKSYWALLKESKLFNLRNRSPSSKVQFNQDAIDNLKSYFDYSNFRKYVDYRLELNFKSNVRELQQRSQWRPLFHHSLETVLSPKTDRANNIESTFLTAFSDHLLHDFTKDFIEQVRKKGIKTGKFQVDLIFKPILNPHFNFDSEITSNKLVNWNATNKFIAGIKKSNEERSTPLNQHLLHTQLPSSGDDYQYKGGIISFWFELGKEGRTSGYVRFRKYFMAPHISKLAPFIERDNFKLNLIHFKKSKKIVKKELYITSDFYQSYSLDKPKPKAERLELHFGKILPNNLSLKNLAQRRIASLSERPISLSKKVQTIDMGDLNLHGVIKYKGQDYGFMSTIESLVFEFKSGQFTKKSKIRTRLKRKKLDGVQRGVLKHKITEKLIEENGMSIIQNFQMHHLHPRFNGGKR